MNNHKVKFIKGTVPDNITLEND